MADEMGAVQVPKAAEGATGRTVRQPYTPTVPAASADGLPVMLRIKDAASVANLSERGLLNLIKSGEVKAIKIGTAWRIPRDSFLRKLGIEA